MKWIGLCGFGGEFCCVERKSFVDFEVILTATRRVFVGYKEEFVVDLNLIAAIACYCWLKIFAAFICLHFCICGLDLCLS